MVEVFTCRTATVRVTSTLRTLQPDYCEQIAYCLWLGRIAIDQQMAVVPVWIVELEVLPSEEGGCLQIELVLDGAQVRDFK
jgi:hypothetical protein